MAFRLNNAVYCGELFNTRKNSVRGRLGLRGFKHPLVFELTGNCEADLAGKHIRFEVRDLPEDAEQPADESESDAERLARLNLTGLAWRQIGPTGTITASHRVRVTDCPPEEMYIRSKLGEPPPMRWTRCLYLEWYGQNGRVVLEMVDPIIEVVEPEPSPGEGKRVSPLELPDGELSAESAQTDLDTTRSLEADAGFASDDEATELGGLELSEEDEDPYGLMPGDLQRQLDEQARATERALHGQDGDAEFIRQMELMDDLIEHSDGEPLSTLFDDVVKLRPPDDLDEQQAATELKILLGRLALYGVALDMCEHMTAVEAYRLLVEEICREEHAYPQLRGTEWVQHFSTSDYCPACQAQFDKEYEDHEAGRQETDRRDETDIGDVRDCRDARDRHADPNDEGRAE